ncbi:MAG TPA: zf-HC2 domain-containing protein, partial [Armatimonadota bacterium]|nr:zf-HC2 domain-containing protein [Armatimonadota bacterium]
MSMTCHQVSQQLIAYIKGELPKEESEQIAAHLTTCPQCRADAQALETAFGILPQLPSAPLTYDLTAIEAATRHSSMSFTPWWRHIAAVAGTAVLLVCGFLAIHRFSSSPMPRAMLSSRPPSPLNVAALPTPSSTGVVAHAPKLRMATASKGPSRGAQEIPVVIHRQPSSPT